MSFFRPLSLVLLLAGSAVAQEKCFETTDELYDAVDAYLDDPSPNSAVAQEYGHPIGTWCTRYIEDFSDMFADTRNPKAREFNENLCGWNTMNARDMSFMFAGAHAFEGHGLECWETGRVKTMEGMFEDAQSFDGDVSKWHVFNVDKFSYMFHGATTFSGDLSEWNTLCAEEFSYMFYTAVNFNSDISGWKVSNANDFRFMFDDAEVFRQNLCPWSAQMSRDLTPTKMFAMFTGTDCPMQDEPGPVEIEGATTLCFDCSQVPGEA